MSVHLPSAAAANLTLAATGHKEKLHFFLFNDILVYANKNDVKKQTDMTKLPSQWPIELVWVPIHT